MNGKDRESTLGPERTERAAEFSKKNIRLYPNLASSWVALAVEGWVI